MSDSAGLGFLLAILSSLPFAAYILPRKLSTLPVLQYQFFLSLAIAPIGVVFAYAFGEGLDLGAPGLIGAIVCGPIWTAGSICYSKAVDSIGVARSTPVKNLAPMFAAVYGIAIFGEYTLGDPASLAMTIIGVGLMIFAAMLLGRAGAPEQEKSLAFDSTRSPEQRAAAMRMGWFYSVATAFFYGLYSWPLKSSLKSGMDAVSACAWLAIGVLASSVALIAYEAVRYQTSPFKPGARNLKLALLAGAIWITAQTMGGAAMRFVPMSISWPVSNLSTLIAMAWGVWVFHEVHVERHKREIGVSFALYAVGIVLLALAAPRGHV